MSAHDLPAQARPESEAEVAAVEAVADALVLALALDSDLDSDLDLDLDEPQDEAQVALTQLLKKCASTQHHAETLALLDQQPTLLNLHLEMGHGRKGVNLLMQACMYNYLDLVRELLKRGADVHARDFLNRTALILAAHHANHGVCELLLLRGLDLMSVDVFGRNALQVYGDRSYLTPAQKELGRQRLGDAWASVKAQAALRPLLEHCASARRAEALALLDQQPTLLDLHWAGEKFRVNKIWAYKSTTALIEAAKGGDLDLVRELLKRGADLHAFDTLDWTALFGAASWARNPEICELLLLRGAHLMVAGGASALALYGSQSRLTPAEREAGRQRLHEASQTGTLAQEALAPLLEHCMFLRRTEALALLDQRPALLNLRWAGRRFEINGTRALQNATVLIVAAKSGDLDLVRELLERGADLHARDSDKWTALFGAAFHAQSPDVCELLLSRGADLMAVDVSGKRALERYGINSNLTDAEKEADRQRLFEVWASGPHPSQVQRRRDERWARRWPFVRVLVCCDFQPTAARKAVLALLHPPLPPDAVIPRLPCTTLAERRALLRDKIFTHPGLWKLVASYL